MSEEANGPVTDAAPSKSVPNIIRDESSSSIPPLPTSVDSTGEKFETPSWKPLLEYSVSIALPVLLGIWMLATGHVPEGLGFFLIAVIFFGGYLFVGFKFSDSTLKAQHKGPLTEGERAALSGDDPVARDEARRIERIGGLLGRKGRGAFAVFSAALDPEEAEVIRENLDAESDATYAWACEVADPEVVGITSPDGLHLVGHVIACNPASRRWVIFAHGYDGCWNEMMLYARRYAARGFNILMPEMRGHGDSEGDWIGMGWLDRLDLVAWARWIVGTKGQDREIVLHGHSMGGASVCMASAEADLPPQVKVTVSDSAYTDALNVFRDIVTRGMRMGAHPLLEIVRSVLMLRGGYDLAKAAPLDAVPTSRVPICFFHGECDSFVAPYMAGRLFEAAGGAAAGEGKLLTMVPHAGHVQSSIADPDRYYGALFPFVERYLDR